MENGVVYDINRYIVWKHAIEYYVCYVCYLSALRMSIVYALFLFLLFVLCEVDCLIINIYKIYIYILQNKNHPAVQYS